MAKPKIAITNRDMNILTALKKHHLTGQMVHDLSQTFKESFSSVENARARLNRLYKAGWLNRDERFQRGRGANEFYYFLTAKSASLFEELEGISKKKAIFRPVNIGIQAHTFLLSEIMVKLNLDIHQFQDIFQLLGFVRENNFIVRIHEKRYLKPDGTIFLKVNGQNQLFFLEVDQSTETVDSPTKESKTFRRKIEIYSEFKKRFAQDEIISSVDGITGYRVLVVCKSVERLQNLARLATSMNKTGMFWFTTARAVLDENYNCLFDRIWMLPGREFKSLF